MCNNAIATFNYVGVEIVMHLEYNLPCAAKGYAKINALN